jgi:hypothetical protein
MIVGGYIYISVHVSDGDMLLEKVDVSCLRMVTISQGKFSVIPIAGSGRRVKAGMANSFFYPPSFCLKFLIRLQMTCDGEK